MKVIYETKTFEAVASRGNKKFWRGKVAQLVDGNIYTFTESWQATKDGSLSKVLTSEPKRIHGKNIGKKNETTPEEQAISEIQSEAAKKCDKGYGPEGEAREGLPLPMLAHKYEDRGHDIVWPAYVQPKLDGVRCLTDGVRFWSRLGKEFDPEVVAHIDPKLMDVVTLDGELMLPQDQFTFQETISAVKKFDPALSPNLQYHVYDVVMPDQTFEARQAWLRKYFSVCKPANVIPVLTLPMTGETEMLAAHDQFVADGYEGLMVRNRYGLYKLKDRSKDLQKVKKFIDAEFKIIGYKEGQAKYARTPIWIVETPGGACDVTPMGPIPYRRRMWADKDELVGQLLTVEFQGYTDKGSLRFPRGKSIRDYE